MKIIHMSDLHICKENFQDMYNRFSDIAKYQKLENFVVVITGDFTDNNRRSNLLRVKELLKIIKKAKKILIIPGNHDYFTFNGNGFFSDKDTEKAFNKVIYGEKNKDFPILNIIDDVAFIGLNSAHSDFFASGKIGSKQLKELDKMLKLKEVVNCKARICYLHHHSFDVSVKWYKFWKRFMKSAMQLNDSKAFLKVIRGGNVNLVLNGHKHSKLGKKTKKNIQFFNGGSSSGKGSQVGFSLIIINKNEVNYEKRWNYYEEL